MAFCNRCGSPVPADASFCQVCGARLQNAPAAGTTPLALGSNYPPSGPAPVAPIPPTPVSGGIPTPMDLPFHPQDGEVFYRVIVPNRRLLWRLMVAGLLSGLLFLVILVPFAASFISSGISLAFLYLVVVFVVVVFAIIVVVSVIYAILAFNKYRYWVTNHRTVGRRGVIGYTIDSIPLETISDVVVQRSIADRIFGLSSVWVQPFGGSSFGGYGAAQYRFGMMGGTNSFLGLTPPEATDVQQLIFHLRDVRRRETGRLI